MLARGTVGAWPGGRARPAAAARQGGRERRRAEAAVRVGGERRRGRRGRGVRSSTQRKKVRTPKIHASGSAARSASSPAPSPGGRVGVEGRQAGHGRGVAVRREAGQAGPKGGGREGRQRVVRGRAQEQAYRKSGATSGMALPASIRQKKGGIQLEQSWEGISSLAGTTRGRRWGRRSSLAATASRRRPAAGPCGEAPFPGG